MDPRQDQTMLSSMIPNTENQILILQEIWQPPIRGLLYYYTQLADTVFSGSTLWIVLIPDMGSQDTTDEDARIWGKAIQTLAHPGLTIERIE